MPKGKTKRLSTSPRFAQSADKRRPFRSHRYEAWSPKIQRRITLYGTVPFHGWIRIESDPRIECFCERPIVIPCGEQGIVVDFWVDGLDGEEFWLIQRSGRKDSNARYPEPGFVSWANSEGISIRYPESEDIVQDDVKTKNWMTMLHYLAANHQFVLSELQEQILAEISTPVTLGALEAKIVQIDPVIVRAAIFSLIHKGLLKSADLEKSLLGLQTQVEVV